MICEVIDLSALIDLRILIMLALKSVIIALLARPARLVSRLQRVAKRVARAWRMKVIKMIKITIHLSLFQMIVFLP